MKPEILELRLRLNGLLKGHNKKTEIRNLVFEKLVENYSQNQRFYHNLDHIAECFREFDKCEDNADCLNSLELGLFFHDVVYNPNEKDNEEKSIQLMDKLLLVHLPPYDLGKAARIILATKHDKIPEENDEKLAASIDLAILGKSWPRYLEYAKAIRQEYSWVREEDYKTGRKKVLENFLKREKIYPHEFFQEKYELTARNNLSREIKMLELDYFSL